MKIKSLSHKNDLYPKLLSTIYNRPAELNYVGELPETEVKLLAVVGSRRPTPYGKEVVERLITGLKHTNVGIVSGLAIGVDALAHRAALNNSIYTLAVLPGGLSRVYPASNQPLAKAILNSGGALVTEYSFHQRPHKHHFLERNRIVAGLAHATLVIEATERSGTISTANYTLQEGRELMAVPGNITSVTSRGTNQLLKTGAHLITDAQDIIELMGLNGKAESERYSPDSENEAKIIKALNEGISESHDILVYTKLSPPIFAQTLTELELCGAIREIGGGNYTLK